MLLDPALPLVPPIPPPCGVQRPQLTSQYDLNQSAVHSFVSDAHFLQFASGQFGSGGGSTSMHAFPPLPIPPALVPPLLDEEPPLPVEEPPLVEPPLLEEEPPLLEEEPPLLEEEPPLLEEEPPELVAPPLVLVVELPPLLLPPLLPLRPPDAVFVEPAAPPAAAPSSA